MQCKVKESHGVHTSIYFFALSHAPPVFDMEIASWTPETREPVNMPANAWVPKRAPIMIGESMTKAPGGIISPREDAVEISTHLKKKTSKAIIWLCDVAYAWHAF
jgi:hypothetical protein